MNSGGTERGSGQYRRVEKEAAIFSRPVTHPLLEVRSSQQLVAGPREEQRGHGRPTW